MSIAGESDVVMLTRSAWAGMQRWGAALWSGDTSSHFASLKVSVQAGLNTQLSGIAWWTTDIGAGVWKNGRRFLRRFLFMENDHLLPRQARDKHQESLLKKRPRYDLAGGYSGGKPSDPLFRELIVRWFQFGLTCPLFRQVNTHPSRPIQQSTNQPGRHPR